MDLHDFDHQPRLVWECDDCGEEYELDALEDLDRAVCEMCGAAADVVKQTRDGWRRGRRRRRHRPRRKP
jgi:hypothetical protein